MRFYVAGRVQGVFFRVSTRDRARALGLAGEVSNLPDGRVSVLACGPDDALRALEAWLWQGPPQAGVTSVQGRPCRDPGCRGFEVR